MLSTLIESRRARSRNRGATAFSVTVHAVVIALGAVITAHVGDRTAVAAPVPPDVVYVAPSEPVPPHEPQPPAAPQAPSEPAIPRPQRTHIEVPKTIPTDIPPVDVSLPPLDTTAFVIAEPMERAPVGTHGNDSRGGSGTFNAWEVEKAVVPLAGNPKPVYPSMLQSGHVEGEVLAQFVVDTTGRVDMSTFRAIQSTNELFVSSVRRALAGWKFHPAEAGGRKVRQLVQMPLTFEVR